MGYLFTILLVYLAFRFVAGFLIPVVRTSYKMKQQFNNMKQQMDENQQGASSGNSTTTKPKFDVEGEYIPFEEVKEKR